MCEQCFNCQRLSGEENAMYELDGARARSPHGKFAKVQKTTSDIHAKRLLFGISPNLATLVSGPVRKMGRCRDFHLATDSSEVEIFREKGGSSGSCNVLRQETKRERERERHTHTHTHTHRMGERTNGFLHPPPALPRHTYYST